MALRLASCLGRFWALGCFVVPLLASNCPDGSGSGLEPATSDEDGGHSVNVCLIQKAVAFESPAELRAGGGIPKQPHASSEALATQKHGEQGHGASADEGANADLHHLWQKRIYPSLISIEPEKHLLGPERTLRLGLAMLVFTVVLSTGFCCMQSRAGSWLLFGVASTLVPNPAEKAGVERAPSFVAPSPHSSATASPSQAAASPQQKALPSTIFSGSSRLLEKLQAGEVAELNLGTRTGSMVLGVSLQSAPHKGGQIVKLEVLQADSKTLVASCMRQDGPHFDVWDAAGHFTGYLRPQEDSKDTTFELLQGSAAPVLCIDITGDGGCLPTPNKGALAARSAGGGTLGKLSLDEDDVEVTLLHSAMDSVVMVSLLGVFLLKK